MPMSFVALVLVLAILDWLILDFVRLVCEHLSIIKVMLIFFALVYMVFFANL